MSTLNNSEIRLLKYLGVGAASRDYALLRVNVEGELNLRQLYLSDKNDIANPIPVIAENGYINELRTRDAVSVLSWTGNAGVKRTQLYRSKIAMNMAGVVMDASAGNKVWDPTASNSIVGGGKAYAHTSNYSDPIKIRDMAEMPGIVSGFKASGLGYTWNTAPSDGTSRGGVLPFTIPDGVVKGFNAYGGESETSVKTSVQWPELSDNNDIGRVVRMMSRAGYFKLEDVITNIPMTASWAWWTTNNAARSLFHPRIPGTRRLAIFMTVPQTTDQYAHLGTYCLSLGGYIWGEGEDVYLYATAQDVNNQVSRYVAFGIMDPVSAVAVARANCIERKAGAYPLDGVAMLNSSIVGDLTETGRASLAFDSSTVEVIDYTLNANSVSGSITPTDFHSYLTTGYGIYKPKSEEDAQKILSTWNLVNNGLFYKIQTVDIAKNRVTFKDTAFYKEYARRRAKACKDNNYMDLPYNQVYTMKQVQNKLEALTTRSVWMQNGSSRAALSAQNTSLGVVTITAHTDNTKFNASVYTYATTGTVQQVVPKSSTAVEGWLETVEGYAIHDSTNILSPLIGNAADGSSFADFNASFAVKRADYDLRPAGFIAGVSLSYHDLIESRVSNDVKCAMLANQVTDFAKFEGVIQKWMKDFSHSQILLRFDELFAGYKEISYKDVVVEPLIV